MTGPSGGGGCLPGVPDFPVPVPEDRRSRRKRQLKLVMGRSPAEGGPGSPGPSGNGAGTAVEVCTQPARSGFSTLVDKPVETVDRTQYIENLWITSSQYMGFSAVDNRKRRDRGRSSRKRTSRQPMPRPARPGGYDGSNAKL